MKLIWGIYCVSLKSSKLSNQNLQPKVTRQYIVGQNPFKIFNPKLPGAVLSKATISTRVLVALQRSCTPLEKIRLMSWRPPFCDFRKKRSQQQLVGWCWGFSIFHGFWGARVVKVQILGGDQAMQMYGVSTSLFWMVLGS